MLAAWLGWLGTAGTFGAYVLLWRGRLSADSRKYAVLNVVGGCMAGLASAAYGAWPSAASNFIWAGVGLQSLFQTTLAIASNQHPLGPPTRRMDRFAAATLRRARSGELVTLRPLRARPVLVAPECGCSDLSPEGVAA